MRLQVARSDQTFVDFQQHVFTDLVDDCNKRYEENLVIADLELKSILEDLDKRKLINFVEWKPFPENYFKMREDC